jgi:hypothetical protein
VGAVIYVYCIVTDVIVGNGRKKRVEDQTYRIVTTRNICFQICWKDFNKYRIGHKEQGSKEEKAGPCYKV